MFNIWHALGDVAPVAKNALFWVVPFGPIAWLSGTIFIDRKNSKESMRKLIKASQTTKSHAVGIYIIILNNVEINYMGIIPINIR